VKNATNDLVLNGGVVGCTTCHAAHNADSNSLTVDAR
jgi:predicted CXXCH cytochrome family protein